MLMRLCLAQKPAFLQDSCQLTLCQCYLKMHVVGEGPAVSLWVLRHFLSLTSSVLACCSPWDHKELDTTEWLNWTEQLYNIQLKTSSGALFLPPSDVYVRSFLYLFYTLIKLYYTKAPSDKASTLVMDWIPLLWRPRISVSLTAQQQPFIYMCVYVLSQVLDNS